MSGSAPGSAAEPGGSGLGARAVPRGAAAACTIAAKPYLAHARVLAESFRAAHPAIPFFVLLADAVDDRFDPDREPYSLVPLDAVGIPELERVRFQYGQQPLTYAATPYLLAHLFECGFTDVLFIKQESLVCAPLDVVFAGLERRPIALAPHLAGPLAGPDRAARELNILQSGVYNVGLVGLRAGAAASAFLAWWQARVRRHCRHAVGEGMHFEQRWLDLVPAFFEGAHLLRDPALNVGHWNLPERALELRDGRVLAAGVPCRLFRFSGFDPDTPQPTHYGTRLTPAGLGPAWAVFELVRDRLLAAGHAECRTWPYRFGVFDNGVPVPEVARAIYLEQGDAVEAFGDPLRTTGGATWFAWLNAPAVDGDPGGPTRLWRWVHARRPDLQGAYPDPAGRDRAAFRDWIVRHGAREVGVSPAFVPGGAA